MSRARILRGEFFLDEEMAQLPMAARLLFQGMWTIADREGRLEDRPSRIKAQVLPYDQADADELLEALAAAGFIIRYEVAAKRFIQIRTFLKHQRPHPREVPSVIPPCPDLPRVEQAQGEPEDDLRPAPGEPDLPLDLDPGSSLPSGSSGSSRAETEILSPGSREVVATRALVAPRRRPTAGLSDAFLRAYHSYPRHVGREDAAKAWARRAAEVGEAELLSRVLRALAWQVDTPDWTKDGGQYVPHFATYLNAGRYDDEPIARAGPVLTSASRRTLEVMQRFAARGEQNAK